MADILFPYLGVDEFFRFPDTESADEYGIVAAGGNLSPGMLLSAYRQGLFPWYSEGEPILWWSPDPRFVLFPDNLHISRSMIRTFKRNRFRYTIDTSFEKVIRECGAVERKGQDATWITGDMIEGYVTLFKLGFVHSVEVWLDGELVGGLYGVSLGSLFFGESMFHLVPDASKAGYILFVRALQRHRFTLVDCQVFTPHLASLGAQNISRTEFMKNLKKGLKRNTLSGRWSGLIDLEQERINITG